MQSKEKETIGVNGRKLKFRAWDTENNRMSPTFDLQKILSCNEKAVRDAMGGYILEKNRILMQYTGLKDKNGKEIYEGDVICYESGVRGSPPFIFTVAWDISKARWAETNLKYPDFYNDGSFLRSSHKVEIIGNIYENSDLLV